MKHPSYNVTSNAKNATAASYGERTRSVSDWDCRGTNRLSKAELILDNLRVHHAKKVCAWVATYSKEIEIFYLPSYSPELNPDEYLNCDLKAEVHSTAPARDLTGLKRKVVFHMRKLQKLPSRVKSYFKHPKIAYAAA